MATVIQVDLARLDWNEEAVPASVYWRQRQQLISEFYPNL